MHVCQPVTDAETGTHVQPMVRYLSAPMGQHDQLSQLPYGSVLADGLWPQQQRQSSGVGRRQLLGRLAVQVLNVALSVAGKQQAHSRCVTLLRRHHQRRVACRVLGIDCSPAAEQQRRDICFAVEC